MRHQFPLFISLAVVIFLPFMTSSQPVSAQQTPDIRDLGTLGGSESRAWDINDRGQVVGWSLTAAGAKHAFLWTDQEGMLDLGTLGGSESEAVAINDRGQVVGWSMTTTGEKRAFLWTKQGGMQDLGTLGGSDSDARDINNTGQVVGMAQVDAPYSLYHPFLWTSEGGMQDLTPDNNDDGVAWGINNRGEVVGQLQLPVWHAFLWTAEDGLQDLGWGEYSWAYEISDTARVVGDSRALDHYALYGMTGGGMRVLPSLGGFAHSAVDVNNRGLAVGFSSPPDEPARATLWLPEGTVQDLGTLGGATSEATAISEKGSIVGWSALASGEVRAALWGRK